MTAEETIIPYDVYRDLLDGPWNGLGKCWGVVVELCRRLGLRVAGDLSDFWEPVTEAKAGDVVLLRPVGEMARDDLHAGVFLGDRKIVHLVGETVQVSRMGPLERAGAVRGIYRHKGRVQLPTVSGPRDVVTVVYVPNILRPFDREVMSLTHKDGADVIHYAPESANVVTVNGKLLGLQHAAGLPVRPGDVLGFATCPEGTETLIALGIGIVLSFLSTLFAPVLPSPRTETETSSPTFSLAGVHNTAAVGIVQPILYGEHRVGGNFIHAFQKSDDTGRSVLYLMLLISRGPIESIAGLTTAQDDLTGAAIPDDIQIDGSPAKNYGARVSVRLGTPDQEPMPGFSELTTGYAYSKTLIPGEAFTHHTVDEIDAFDLILDYPLGLYNVNTSTGVVEARAVAYTVRYRITGTTPWTSSIHQHTDARRGSRTRQITIRGLTRAKYDIEITRYASGTALPNPIPGVQSTAGPWPEVESDKESRSDLIEVNEISTKDTIWYSDLALLGVIVTATDQLSGDLPTITVKAKGRKVWVWNGVSESNPDFGTAKVYTDNPAWCTLDMLINPHDGLYRNSKITLNNIGLAEFDSWADNCDLIVADGRGGTFKRATLDVIVDEVKKGWEFVQSIAFSHWARLYIANNEIRCIVEKASTPVALLGMGNLKEVTFSYKGRRRRPNRVVVQYFNEETNYEADTMPRQDDVAILTNGEPIFEETIQAVGVTRPGQAARLAQWRMLFHSLSKRAVEGATGVENIHLLPGDVVEVQHEANKVGLVHTSGRVLAATGTTVTLDADIFASGTFKITVRTSATGQDVLQERTITNGTYARGTAITVTAAWNGGDVPVIGDPYVCGQLNSYYRPYRIQSIETDPSTLERRMSLSEHTDAIYSDDPGDVETFTDQIPNPRTMGTVADLHLSEQAILCSDGSTQDMIRVEWTRPEAWFGADVWYRVRTDTEGGAAGLHEWRLATRAQNDFATIGPFGLGSYVEVAVTAVSKKGTRPLPENSPQAGLYILGPRRRPGAPQAIEAQIVQNSLHVRLTPPADARDVAGYEIRYGSTWAGSVLLSRRAASDVMLPLTFGTSQTIRARSVSRAGRVSSTEVTISVEVNVATSVYMLDTTQTEDPGWTGTKTNTSVDGTSIGLSGANLTGTYQIATIAASGGVLRSLIEVTAGLKNVERRMDECLFRLTDPQASTPMNAFYLDGRECEPGFTIEEMAAIPLDGLVGTCQLASGRPIDIVAALDPDITWNIGGGARDYYGTEIVTTSLDATLALNRPHSRYQPQASGMEVKTYEFA